jgi:hypothetical protein
MIDASQAPALGSVGVTDCLASDTLFIHSAP